MLHEFSSLVQNVIDGCRVVVCPYLTGGVLLPLPLLYDSFSGEGATL